MLLIIDIGNTNIVLAIFDGDQKIKSWRLETSAPFHVGESGIENIIVSSVVPHKDEEIIKVCESQLDTTPFFVNYKNVGLKIHTDHPEQVGADRLVNAVAVVHEYNQPTIIVDFGTATTFDVVDGEGNYFGGVISPGINLSLKALGEAAANLPTLKVEKPNAVIGKNTVDAMQSGIYWGYIGLIEGNIDRIQKEIGQDCTIVATGGLAPLFAENTDYLKIIDPDLTLKGLVHIHNDMQQKAAA
ncbi:MAG: type III pantothenate kinase [Pseudomonadota bacterium]